MGEGIEMRNVTGMVLLMIIGAIVLSIGIWIAYTIATDPCSELSAVLYIIPGLAEAVGAIYGPC